MENIKTINVPQGIRWIGDFMDELPVNCLFDKTITGCGRTNLALTNGKHTIVAMPFVNLVDNKVTQKKHKGKVLGVFKGVSNEDVENYIRTYEVWKIACTYDSLPRVIDTILHMGIDVYNEFFLLIDEWHILFNQYVFREKAIRNLLDVAFLFKEVTYMTATPIEEELILGEVKHLPVVKLHWPNVETVTVLPQKTNSCEKHMVKVIKEHLQLKLKFNMHDNLHIFVNSVDFITKVITEAELTPDDVKIVCSNSPINQKKLGDNYSIGKPLDPVKNVNFYTSTSFEGCDIFDTNGKTYIVSDKKRQHSLLDISTLVIQICGRIRNSQYRNKITHVFSGKKYDVQTLDEYKATCLDKYAQSISYIAKLNAFSKEERLKTIRIGRNKLDTEYIKVGDSNMFEIDENLMNLDIHNFKIHNLVYQDKITVAGEYQKQGFEVGTTKYDYYTDKLMKNSKVKVSFEDLFLEYVALRSKPFWASNPRVALIEQERPLVRAAYSVLGADVVVGLKYRVGNIKRELTKRMEKSNEWKATKMLMEQIRFSEPIEVKKAKKIIQNIYDDLGINKKAKSTDLDKFFYTKQAVKNSVRFVQLIKARVVE